MALVAPRIKSLFSRPLTIVSLWVLLIVVGTGDGRYGDVVRRFDRADGDGKVVRVYLSVRSPKELFKQKRRLSVGASGIRIIRVAGVADHGLSYRAPKVQD